ncbi:MAG: hypothetical protein ACQEQV_03195 [Fibrobacterota bacterium]
MKPVCGLHFTSDYIVLARREGREPGVDSVSIQPLDESVSYEKALREGLDQLVEHQLLAPKEEVSLAFLSEGTHIFQTELPTGIDDIHEMMSWELMLRINDSVDNYLFDTVSVGLNRAVGIAVREEEVRFYMHLLKKRKIRLSAVDSDVIALFNLFDLNYDTASPAVLLMLDRQKVTFILVQNRSIYSVAQLPPFNAQRSTDDELHRLKEAVRIILKEYNYSKALPTYFCGDLLTDTALQDRVLATIPQSRMLNPFNRLSSGIGMDEATLDRFSPLIAVAVGLAQREAQ